LYQPFGLFIVQFCANFLVFDGLPTRWYNASGGDSVGRISFDKLEMIMRQRGKVITDLRKDGILVGQTFTNFRNGGNINSSKIAAICAYLGVQPGDIMEYVPDEQEPPQCL
jgi:DNA-binding Xre family transcriptional regulator